jgi:hypothetical protein
MNCPFTSFTGNPCAKRTIRSAKKVEWCGLRKQVCADSGVCESLYVRLFSSKSYFLFSINAAMPITAKVTTTAIAIMKGENGGSSGGGVGVEVGSGEAMGKRWVRGLETAKGLGMDLGWVKGLEMELETGLASEGR